MGVSLAAVGTWLGSAAGAAGTAAAVGEAATVGAGIAGAGALAGATATGGMFGGGFLGAATAAETVGIGAGLGGYGAGTYAAAAGGGVAGGFGTELAKTAGGAAATAGVQGMLAPKPPKVPGQTPMPDPLQQEEARKRSIAEQMARRGRASTVLTAPGGGGKLGG
jgi:hypothetical protein